MTVYIEYVLIDNLLIDYMLLKATFLITGNGYSKGRLFFCALLGAGVALVFPLLALPSLLLGALKILVGLLLLLISASYKNKRAFYINAVVFFALTFALGGALIGVYGLFNLDYSSELSIALIFLPAYVLIRVICGVVSFVYKRKTVASCTVDCELTLNGVTQKLKGFFDTGNGLYDGSSPVIICEKKVFTKFFGGEFLPKLSKLTFQTVSGEGQMFTVKLDAVKIYLGQTSNIYNNVTLGVSGASVGQGYDVILHPALGGENGKFDTSIKEVG